MYGIWGLITSFVSARHLYLSWARSIQSMPPSHFLKIQFNIILPSTPRACRYFPYLRFPHQNPVCTCPHPHTCYTPLPSHSSCLNHPNNIRWGVQNIKLPIMQFSPFSCYPVLLGPNILPSFLVSNTLSLRSSLHVKDQVSHPYKKHASLYFRVVPRIRHIPVAFSRNLNQNLVFARHAGLLWMNWN